MNRCYEDSNSHPQLTADGQIPAKIQNLADVYLSTAYVCFKRVEIETKRKKESEEPHLESTSGFIQITIKKDWFQIGFIIETICSMNNA